MALEKKPDYRKKYPGLSDEIIKVLEQSDRKIEYQQYDLKTERFRVHYAAQTVICVPSREDSYDRLLEETGSLPPMARAWRILRSKR